MDRRFAFVMLALSFASIMGISGATQPSCSSPLYLTLYNNLPANASVGIDNITLSAYLAKFQYNTTALECTLYGLPNANISFYLTSTANYVSPYYNTLFKLGTVATNSTGYATVRFNSSVIGPGTYSTLARWYGNSSYGSTQSNNVTIVLLTPVAGINTTCYGDCGNVTKNGLFTLVSYLCVGRQPFSWSTCNYLPNQKLTFNASGIYLGSGITNSSGGTSVTYNTVLLKKGSYSLYSTWLGGPKYAGLVVTTAPAAGLDLNIFTVPSNSSAVTTSTTTTAKATTTTSSGQSSSQSSKGGLSSTYLYVGIAVVVIIIIIAALLYSKARGRRHEMTPMRARPQMPQKPR